MTTALEQLAIPTLRANRLVIRHSTRDALAPKILPEIEAEDQVCYRSVRGTICGPDEACRLLDSVLERILPDAFEPVPARDHWETEEPLPAGPGPFGSGFRALGSRGETIEARDFTGPYRRHGLNGDDDESYWDSIGEPEAWREVLGTREEIRDWLVRTMRWSLNDRSYEFVRDGEMVRTTWSDSEEEKLEMKRQKGAFERGRVDLAARLVERPVARYFVGAHTGWDQYREDYLSRDEVVGIVTPDSVVVVWMFFYRFYG